MSRATATLLAAAVLTLATPGPLTAATETDAATTEAATTEAATTEAATTEAETIVSLTFDDGWASHELGGRILADQGLRGTFYINSGFMGAPEYLNWEQVNAVAAEGHEIGGHSLTHPDLSTLPEAQARTEICDDRSQQTSRGYPGLSFAYPYAAANDTVRDLVRECGYSSGRDVTGLRDPDYPEANPDGALAETVPPANPFGIRTPLDDAEEVTVDRLKRLVAQAQETGGWMPLVFHRVCDACAESYYVLPDVLEGFASWLKAEQDSGRLVVKTVGEVITGQPLPAPPPLAEADKADRTQGGLPRWTYKVVIVVLLAIFFSVLLARLERKRMKRRGQA